MNISAAAAGTLLSIEGIDDDAERVHASLRTLASEVLQEVPSCLAISIHIARLGNALTVTTRTDASGADPHDTPVLASLALPLSAIGPHDMLVLRAAEAGAFVLMADDLQGLLGSDHAPLALDAHLDLPADQDGAQLATSTADFHLTNRAIGALIAGGLPPEAARRLLQRRAQATNRTAAQAARGLLDLLPAGSASGADG